MAPLIAGHEVCTTQQQGWSGLSNGELLRWAAAAGFDVFLTSDQNLEFQQNLSHAALFVIVRMAPTNRLEHLAPLIPSVLTATAGAAPGKLIRIEA